MNLEIYKFNMNNKVFVDQDVTFPEEFDKGDIEMVDAEVNVEIDANPSSVLNDYASEDDSNIDIRQLEDDKNSSTGNI